MLLGAWIKVASAGIDPDQRGPAIKYFCAPFRWCASPAPQKHQSTRSASASGRSARLPAESRDVGLPGKVEPGGRIQGVGVGRGHGPETGIGIFARIATGPEERRVPLVRDTSVITAAYIHGHRRVP